MTYTIDIPQDFNVTNQVNFLKQAGSLENDESVILTSIACTYMALDNSMHSGQTARVVNKTNGMKKVDHFPVYEITQHISELPVDTNKTTIQFGVSTEVKEQLEFIKRWAGMHTLDELKTDTQAVRFALQFTYEVTKHMQQCKGKAYIAFPAGWGKHGLGDTDIKMYTVFDKTFSAKFGRAGRKVKNAVKKILPTKKPPQLKK